MLYKKLLRNKVLFYLIHAFVFLVLGVIPLTAQFESIPIGFMSYVIGWESSFIFAIILIPLPLRHVKGAILTKDLIVHYPISNCKRILYSVFSSLSDPGTIICFFASMLLAIVIDFGYIYKIVIFIYFVLIIFNCIVWLRFLIVGSNNIKVFIGALLLFMFEASSLFLSLLGKNIVTVDDIFADINNSIYIIIFLLLLLFSGIYLTYLFDRYRIPQSNYTG